MKSTDITLSVWANRLLWQSPKSRPHSLTFLSADALTSMVLSVEMAMLMTGKRCPYLTAPNDSVLDHRHRQAAHRDKHTHTTYRDKKNLSVSS